MTRRGCAVLALVLLLAPCAVRSEDVAQPVPADKACTVPWEERWTESEGFIWDSVCGGKDADLNEKYGTVLDPADPKGWGENRLVTSAFLEAILLKDKYRQALTHKGVRIIGARFTEIVDLEDADLRHALYLDSCRLEKGADFRGMRSTRSISLTGSKIHATLDMERVRVNDSIFMGDAEIGRLMLSGAHIGGQLNLIGANVADKVEMDSIEVGESLLMRDGIILGDMMLTGAHIGGQVDLSGAHVDNHLGMDSVRIGHHLLMREDADSKRRADFGDVTLSGARIDGIVDLNRAYFFGQLNMRLVQVGGMLAAREMTGSIVNLSAAHVGGFIDLGKSNMHGDLDMNGLSVDSSLLMDQLTSSNGVDLKGARIGGQLNLQEATIGKKLDMSESRVAESVFMGSAAHSSNVNVSCLETMLPPGLVAAPPASEERHRAEFGAVDMLRARIGGALDLGGVTVKGKLDAQAMEVAGEVFINDQARFNLGVLLNFSKVGSLLIAGGTVAHFVDLTGLQITNDLNLGSFESGVPCWPESSALILRNASANAIQDQQDSWPKELDLVGFTYRHLNAIEPGSMADRGDDWFERWLRKTKYSPQPYVQLAAVLRTQGMSDAADEILYAGREREREEASSAQYLWLTAQWLVIGYGYHVFWALWWYLALMALGAAAAAIRDPPAEENWRGFLTGLRQLQRTRKLPSDAADWRYATAMVKYVEGLITYSFEMMLPLVRLRGDTRKHEHLVIDCYFHLHGLAGLVLTSFLAAGLAGLTK